MSLQSLTQKRIKAKVSVFRDLEIFTKKV